MDGLLLRRRMMMGVAEESRLPAGYRERRYVTSNSQAYIDTGVPGDNDSLVIEVKFMSTKFTQYGSVFSNYSAEGARCWRIIRYINTQLLVNTNFRPQNNAVSDQLSTNVLYHFRLSWGHLYNVTAETDKDFGSKTKGNANNNNIVLANGPAHNNRDIGLNIYYFKIDNGDTPLLEYIPCTDPNGVPGFYDLVTETFKPSDSATPFVAGPTV